MKKEFNFFTILFLFLCMGSNAQVQRTKKEILNDTSLFVTHFDSSYVGLLMNLQSKTYINERNEYNLNDNSKNQYHQQGGGAQYAFLTFSNGKSLTAKTAAKYFALVPAANKKFKTARFFQGINKIGAYSFYAEVGALIPGFVIASKNDNEASFFHGMLFASLSSAALMFISMPFVKPNLKKAVKLYNEYMIKIKNEKH